MADLSDSITPRYSENDIISVAMAWIRSTDENVLLGKLSREEATGSKAAVLGILLMLGIEVHFSDGTVWKPPQGGKNVIDPRVQPPKPGRERLN